MLRVRIAGAPRVLNHESEMNERILRRFGATVGTRCRLFGPITLHNCDRGYQNLVLGDNCVFNGNHYLDLTSPVTLESGVSLGPGTTIMTHNGYNRNSFLLEQLAHTVGKKPVLIRQGACIKAGVLVTMGVTIGRNAVVAGNAVVNRDVPDDCFVAGVPARLVKRLEASPKEGNRTPA